MTKETTWTLERKKYNSFKAHHTNSPSGENKRACMYLVDLTTITIDDNDK